MYDRSVGVLPDAQGSVLILFLPTMVLLVIYGSKLERVLCACALPFVLNSVVSSYQRTYFVALLVESLALLFFLPRKVSVRLLPVFAAAALLYVVRLTPADYWERVATITRPAEEASANSRFVVNDASWRMFKDHPLLGVGYRNYPDVSPLYLDARYLDRGRRSAHNSYFTVLCETGAAGFLPWAGAVLGTVWYLRRARKGEASAGVSRVQLLAMGIEVGLYGWAVGGWTMSDHEVDPVFWFVAITVVLVRLHARREEGRPAPDGPGPDGEGEAGPGDPAAAAGVPAPMGPPL